MQIHPVVAATLNHIKNVLVENSNTPIDLESLAWGVVALEISGDEVRCIDKLRSRLIPFQMGDGRFCLSTELPETYWPTPIVLLGLLHCSDFQENKKKAVEFLLRTSGVHWKKKSDDPSLHDPSIVGWPWIGNTHSWVIPTSMAILVLKLYGFEEHERVVSGVRMLMDRQIDSGGWNYGNTVVFKSELRPFPECTGYALSALQGSVSEQHIAGSLSYLKNRIDSVRTPLSLSWALLGLGAWSQRPTESGTWIVETLQKQERYGPYSVSLLSQLVISYYSENGLYSLMKRL